MPQNPLPGPQERIAAAIANQQAQLGEYGKASDLITLETLRALDDLFCRDLILPGRGKDQEERQYRALSTWGVNHALSRVLPARLEPKALRFLASSKVTQDTVDEFLFSCGALRLGERFQSWLREGAVTGSVSRHDAPEGGGTFDVLVLRSTASHADEDIGWTGIRWASSLATARLSGQEQRLNARFKRLRPQLENLVGVHEGWAMTYASTPEIDEHFADWARLYLSRIYAQDLIGPDDRIGGRPFSSYVAVLTSLSARAHMHLAYATILHRRHPDLHLRNLLTGAAVHDQLVSRIAGDLGGDRAEIAEILQTLTLSPDNASAHLAIETPAWAPLVRPTADTVFLPIYGIDINPFLFLMNDLRARHSKDWFSVANHRERRWIEELQPLFPAPRWQTNDRNLKLREGKQDVTDIDFAAFDNRTQELALFQLKWQQPIGADNRVRRSAGRNMLDDSNRWIEDVTGWIGRHGIGELAGRLGFAATETPALRLVVLGRYHAHFTGFDARDARATWSDWGHFRKARVEGPRRSIGQALDSVDRDLALSRRRKRQESLMVPVGELGIVLNPLSTPWEADRG